MPVVAVVPLTRAIQYDGTNSAEIDAAITELTIVSEFGGNLTIESNGGHHTVPTNGYLIFNQSGIVIEATSATYFDDYYKVVPEVSAGN